MLNRTCFVGLFDLVHPSECLQLIGVEVQVSPKPIWLWGRTLMFLNVVRPNYDRTYLNSLHQRFQPPQEHQRQLNLSTTHHRQKGACQVPLIRPSSGFFLAPFHQRGNQVFTERQGGALSNESLNSSRVNVEMDLDSVIGIEIGVLYRMRNVT